MPSVLWYSWFCNRNGIRTVQSHWAVPKCFSRSSPVDDLSWPV